MISNNILSLIARGGYVIYILAFCSILSLKVIIEKLIIYKGVSEKAIKEFMDTIYIDLETKDYKGAIHNCRIINLNWMTFKIKPPLSNVIRYILENHKTPPKELEIYAYTQLDKEIAGLEKGLGVLSTLGSISPFIGLFGTVIGIIQSFNALSLSNTSNYSSVMSGIADALIATAAGLVVAVPAVLFYNFFNKKLKLSLPLHEEAIQKTIGYLKTSERISE